LWQQNYAILIAARGVHDYPCTRCTALVAWGVRHVRRNKDLVPGLRCDAVLQSITVKYDALAAK
jgi:hypothetical protein